jgi:hypothetical protein
MRIFERSPDLISKIELTQLRLRLVALQITCLVNRSCSVKPRNDLRIAGVNLDTIEERSGTSFHCSTSK